jgi:hypothetical protein
MSWSGKTSTPSLLLFWCRPGSTEAVFPRFAPTRSDSPNQLLSPCSPACHRWSVAHRRQRRRYPHRATTMPLHCPSIAFGSTTPNLGSAPGRLRLVPLPACVLGQPQISPVRPPLASTCATPIHHRSSSPPSLLSSGSSALGAPAQGAGLDRDVGGLVVCRRLTDQRGARKLCASLMCAREDCWFRQKWGRQKIFNVHCKLC